MTQERLFNLPDAPPEILPEGFYYEADIITPEEEQSLIQEFAKLPLSSYMYQGYEAKRRIIYFGLDHEPGSSALRKTTPIPEYLQPLKEKAARFVGVASRDIEHALVTEYVPGTPIGWHRDSPPFDKVIGVSFGAPCTFRMRRAIGGKDTEKTKDVKWDTFSRTVEPRSIYIMEGPARYVWQHNIPPVTELRYSVTFRTVQK